MLKVFGHPVSTCTRKVLTTIAENGLQHEFVLVDLMTGAHKQPDHLARQPFGQVPSINDDGFELFESRAICRYLDGKSNNKLVPSDAKSRALMEQWISVEMSNFTPHAMTFIFQHIFKSDQGAEALTNAENKLTAALTIMDAHLAKHPYFAGQQFSLADVSFMPYVDYLLMTPAKDLVLKWPNVAAWWGRASDRQSWRTATGK
ncbi:MAG: glutathione S-transferase N-terminal domain-containing protein [Kofleriaceae bacterium]